MSILRTALPALLLATAVTMQHPSELTAHTPDVAPPTGISAHETAAKGVKDHGKPKTDRPARGNKGPRSFELPCLDKMRGVPHQGPSCHVKGNLFKVKLKDGSFVYTHGADPLHDHDADHDHDSDAPGATGQSGNLGTVTARNPVCTAKNPHGSYAFRAIIAIPSDGTQTITAAQLRTTIQKVNGAFYKSAVESGSPNGGDLVFDCDAAGAIAVDVVRLPTSRANSKFSTIVSDLKAKGYTSLARNYAVYFTSTFAGMGGQGDLQVDSLNSASNANNKGGHFAIDYGVNTASTLMHELGHNLGAVQPGAPHATGSNVTGNWGHCYESYDVMCYNDGGSTDPGTITKRCTDFDHFDCGHDDYFDAVIGAGQGVGSTAWLATHFNIGACYAVFVVNRACTADTTPPAMAVPSQSIQKLSKISNGLVPVAFAWSATDPGGIAKFDPWIIVDGTPFQQANGTATSGSWNLTPGSSYQMAVRAQDAAGNWSAYAYGPLFTVDAFQENSTAVKPVGTWTPFTGSYFGGREIASGYTGNSVTLSFTGRAIAWYGALASNRGDAKIYIDDVYIGSLVSSNAATVSLATAVYSKTWSASGPHKIKVEVYGTAGRPAIDLDAFVALR